DRLLLLNRAQGVVELEVRVRLGDGERHQIREGLRRLALELLVPVLVGPAGGQIHQPLVVPAQRQKCHVSSPRGSLKSSGAPSALALRRRLGPLPESCGATARPAHGCSAAAAPERPVPSQISSQPAGYSAGLHVFASMTERYAVPSKVTTSPMP